jgi:uncharacterized protein (TIGR02444 family)
MPTDLWDFAKTLYARPGVEQACLQLQEGGADICLLLTALWLERRQVACSKARSTALQVLAKPWRENAIKPLRLLRQDWRTRAQHDQQLALLREQIKAVELQVETALLRQLQQCSRDWPSTKAGDWLSQLAGEAGRDNRDALDNLRIAAATV